MGMRILRLKSGKDSYVKDFVQAARWDRRVGVAGALYMLLLRAHL